MRNCSFVNEQFYLLEDPGDASAFSGIVLSGGIEDESVFEWLPKRYGLQLFARGQMTPRLRVDIGKNTGWREPSSVVWVQLSCLVIRASLLEALRPFSGWSKYHVRVSGSSDNEYVGLAIWGRSGMTSMKPHIELIDEYEHYVGMTFDPASWDGSDIFYPSRGRGPIVSEAVKTALLNASVSNVRLIPLPNVQFRVSHYHQVLSQSQNPDSDPEFNDPLRPYMFQAQSIQRNFSVVDRQILLTGIASEFDRPFICPGIRIVMFDDDHEVDAIVRSVELDGEISADPIRFGHGSLRPRIR